MKTLLPYFKKITSLLILMLFMAFVQRSFGQTAASYTFSATSGTYASISGGTSPGSSFLADDATKTSIPLGFTFAYAGNTYTTLSACSNGWLAFSNSSSTTNVNNLTNGTLTNMLAPLWDDLSGASSGPSASYSTTGTTGAHIFTFEWNSWRWNYQSNSNVISFEVKLYEATGVIEFWYQQGTKSVNSGSASVGICGLSGDYLSVNAAGTAASSTTETKISTRPASGTIYRFTPTPNLSALPTSLAFGNQAAGTTSATKTFSLSGTNLSPASGNITVTASAGYLVNNGTSWVSSYTVAYSGAALSATTVSVQFAPTALGSIPGTISFTGSGDPSPPTVALTGTGIAGAAAKLVFIQQPTNTASTVVISPSVTVQVQDANGYLVSGTNSITLAIGTNPASGTLSGTKTVSAVGGVATFSTLSIDKIGTGYTLAATATSLTGATSSAFNITLGAASKLVFGTQPSTTVAGSAISPAITVQVQDIGGNLITTDTRNITLAIGTNPGGGTLSGTATVAAVGGIATFSDLSINKTGTGYTLAATSSPSLTGTTSTAFNITAGAASKLVFGTQPGNTVGGASITPAVTVQVQDANGNLVTTATSVTLAIGTNPSSGVLSGTTTVSSSAGIATFSSLSINKTGNGYTLVASAGSLTGATSNTFNIIAGAASKLVFVQQPTSTTSTAVISPAITVQVQDANGNLVTTATNSITLAIGTNPGSGTLSGTKIVSASGGIASFSTLSIDKIGTGYTLTATATSLTGGTSSAFNITLGAPTKLVFGVQPSNTVAGATISPAVTVQIQDAGGNIVTTDTRNITLAFGTNAGGGTLSGTLTIAASAGISNFSDLSIIKTGTGYTLAASSSPALTGVTSNTFNITPGPLASLTMSTIANPQPVDSVFTSAVTITGTDVYGNPVNGGSLTMTTTAGSITPNPVTLGATGSASPGSVTVSNFKVTQSGTGKTITATSGSIFVTSNPFDVSTFNSSATGDFFISNANNVDWALISSWQGSHDGTNWYTPTAYPSSTATSITVQSIHTINVSSSVSSSSLTINGKVNVNASGNLSNTGSITSNISTLLINAGGKYTHNRDGGAIPTAKWDVASTCYMSGIGSNGPTNSSLSQTFGNYTWDCASQSDDIPSPVPATIKGSLTINNTNGNYITIPSTVTVSGDFIMHGGTFGMDVDNAFFGSSQTGTLNIAGNFTMTGGILQAVAGSAVFGPPNATFNINFNGSSTQVFTKTGGTIYEKDGGSVFSGASHGINNFTINSGSTVDFGTSVLDGAANFTLSSNATLITANQYGITTSGTGSTGGTINVNGTRSFSSLAKYIYDGTTPQNTGVFTTTTTASTIANLTINNAAGVTLSQPLTVTGTLFLTNGILTTTTNLLSLSSTASATLAVSDYTNTSYVNGPIQKTGSSAFIFPVGKIGTGYVPISISATSNSSSQTFRAEYIHSSATALGVIATGSRLQRVSSCDYWNLNLYSSAGVQQSALPAGVTVNLTLNWNQNSACNAITDLSSLAIGHFSSPTWDEAVVGGIYNPPTGNATNGSITSVGVANFSPFALATTNGISNPLPITLDYFTATKQVGYNKLTWKVECSSSSSSFDVERSYDGISFKAINTVKVSSATDCATPFVYDDYNSNGSKVYYRIKMVDIDDNAKYSNIELISSDANAIELMNIQPNPVYGDANLKISASGVQNIELAIIGIDGKQMQHKTLQVQQGTNNVQLNTGALAKGVYFVKGIFANGQTNVIKFIKQ